MNPLHGRKITQTVRPYLAAVGGAGIVHFRPGRNLSAAASGSMFSSSGGSGGSGTVGQSMPLVFGEMPRRAGGLSKGRVPVYTKNIENMRQSGWSSSLSSHRDQNTGI